MGKSTTVGLQKRGVAQSVVRLLIMVFRTGRAAILMHLFVKLLCGLLPAAAALLWQRVLGAVEVMLPQSNMLGLFVMLAIVGGLSVSYTSFTEITDTMLRNRISREMQTSIHEKACILPMDDYESAALNDILARASIVFCYGDAVGFVVVLFGLVELVVAVVTMGFVLWSYHPLLALSAILMFLPCAAKLWINKSKVNLDVEMSPIRREADGLRRYLTKYEHVKEVRALQADEFFLTRWKDSMSKIIEEEETLNRKATLVRMLMDMLERGANIASYLLCCFLALDGKIDVAKFGAVIVMVGQYTQKYRSVIWMLQNLFGESLSIQRGMEYFDLPTENRLQQIDATIECIRLDNVTYAYPQANRNAVEEISFNLHAGETIAVIGPNGSGKSTLSKLVMGLIDPQSGTVSIEGTSAKEVAYSSLYQHTTSVLQDHVHYYLQVRDNITISAEGVDATDDQLESLLSQCRVRFIGKDGDVQLDSALGVEYGGVELSGGQWQQLAIARAGWKEAQIVVLDEPTSALDPLKEAEMYETFQRLCQGKIGMIITHRLGLCAYADKILVMEQGHMIEYGTGQELLRANGVYAKMFRAQSDLYITVDEQT